MTRNPRVDFISRRVEDIKTKKANVSHLAGTAKQQLDTVRKTLVDLDAAMVQAFNDELGERKWDDDKSTYTRILNPEERRLVADMERVHNRCRETLDKVLETYLAHLDETVAKPLTFHTPDEEMRLTTVMTTKEEYKAVRTLYSDAMIDVDSDLSTGSAPSSAAQTRLDESKREYEAMSERLCDDALRYERVYRDELAQRVSAHFVAEMHLLRGVSTAMRDFAPYTKGLTLDWQQMRATRRSNLAAAKSSRYDDDERDAGALDSRGELPPPPPADPADTRDLSGDGNPFQSMAGDLQRKSTNAAAALSSAGKSASKSITDMVSSYGTKSATKAATKSVTGDR